ncbi:hypothetical protein BLNAU_24545 [Blattamonas nauphoetae]|nr:hypothetical protein BLNAU_24545 [Blattamonas nauphoetae]
MMTSNGSTHGIKFRQGSEEPKRAKWKKKKNIEHAADCIKQVHGENALRAEYEGNSVKTRQDNIQTLEGL